jgi:DNA-binding MarR family transcriptional regulator
VCPTVAVPASARYRFGDLLALARRSWVAQVRARVESSGFHDYRRSDAWVLRQLAPGPQPIGRLGSQMGVTRQAARKVADGLVERGYAVFEADPSDARRTLVALTGEGESFARAVGRAQDALNEAVRERVNAGQLAAADSVLRSIFPETERLRIDEILPPRPSQ